MSRYELPQGLGNVNSVCDVAVKECCGKNTSALPLLQMRKPCTKTSSYTKKSVMIQGNKNFLWVFKDLDSFSEEKLGGLKILNRMPSKYILSKIYKSFLIIKIISRLK